MISLRSAEKSNAAPWLSLPGSSFWVLTFSRQNCLSDTDPKIGWHPPRNQRGRTHNHNYLRHAIKRVPSVPARLILFHAAESVDFTESQSARTSSQHQYTFLVSDLCAVITLISSRSRGSPDPLVHHGCNTDLRIFEILCGGYRGHKPCDIRVRFGSITGK